MLLFRPDCGDVGHLPMSMARILDWELNAFLWALLAVVLLQLLTGHIRLGGLLREKDGSGAFSPARVQLLIATLATGTQFLGSLAQASPDKLPALDNRWLYLISGSSGLYAWRKLYTFIRSRKP